MTNRTLCSIAALAGFLLAAPSAAHAQQRDTIRGNDKPVTPAAVAKNTEKESKRVANRTGKAVRKAGKQTEKQAHRTGKQLKRLTSRKARRAEEHKHDSTATHHTP